IIHRQPSTWETYSAPPAAMSKPRRHCGRRHGWILRLRKLGTISATCSTSRGGPKPPSTVYAKACRQRLTTQTPRSTWLCCCNKKKCDEAADYWRRYWI